MFPVLSFPGQLDVGVDAVLLIVLSAEIAGQKGEEVEQLEEDMNGESCYQGKRFRIGDILGPEVFA